MPMLYHGLKEILKIQKLRRVVSYTGFYCFVAVMSYAYTTNTTRAGYSRGDQFYAAYPAGTELLTDATKVCETVIDGCCQITFVVYTCILCLIWI
ncbi:diadenosine 5' family protein [Populus alba x Populus x berolinensis]|nr:diadenosine 5' family protein [Populus alba x Populus x berolinensis]